MHSSIEAPIEGVGGGGRRIRVGGGEGEEVQEEKEKEKFIFQKCNSPNQEKFRNYRKIEEKEVSIISSSRSNGVEGG